MKTKIITYLLIIIWSSNSYSQSEHKSGKYDQFRVMFYNVENYFDAEHDSTLSYNEFTPNGDLHWTNRKYIKKRNNIYKVIKAIGEWNPVALIGLVEVENEFVVSDLIYNTPLANYGYGYIHYESNDFRGIDVALVYHSKSFRVLHSEKVIIRDPKNPNFTTRDMLYVKGLLDNDTLHVIISHWTSRYRGYLESEPYRILASKRLIQLTDSICATNSAANIILMGDFNDDPENKSMQLITKTSICKFKNMDLSNNNPNVSGTLKYKSNWSNFDQILISQSLLTNSNGITCSQNGHIFDADYLLESDSKYFGLKTNRTNIGFKYHDGFSDHLPIYIDLSVTNK